MVGGKFPKDLLAELCAEMPDFKDVVVFHGHNIDAASLDAIARVIDVQISHHKEVAKIAIDSLGKRYKGTKTLNKKEEALKDLKNRVLSLSSL